MKKVTERVQEFPSYQPYVEENTKIINFSKLTLNHESKTCNNHQFDACHTEGNRAGARERNPLHP